MTDESSGRQRPWLPPTLAALTLIVATAVVFQRQLFEQWTFAWDFLGTYSASPAFVAATFGHGHFITFSPFVASGFPVAVNTQAELYFPIWWLLGALGIPATLSTVTDVQVGHVLFAGWGMLMLARVRGLSWRWATISGLAYLLFGGFYGEAEHSDIVRGFAYLPWLLWSLTPPAGHERWYRLAALPLLAWVIAAGAYPAQLVSFFIVGSVYTILELRRVPDSERRHRLLGLLIATLACVAVCIAVLLPYLLAQHDHQLVRLVPPTAANRAAGAITFTDFLGLYLNSFAWQLDGSVTAWAIAVPVLVGLAFVTRGILRQHLPLVATGAVALLLAMTPRIGPIGRAMANFELLFPSRFPAADYKAAVILAVILVSIEGWAAVAARRVHGRRFAAAAVACLLLAGALTASNSFAPTTRTTWLLVLVIVAAAVLAITRPRPLVLAVLLIILIGVDGVREVRDARLGGSLSAWQGPPGGVAATAARARDPYIRTLAARIVHPPATRPARVPPAAPIATRPAGTSADASGWVGDGYHALDYGGTMERVLYQAEQDPRYLALLLRPWQAYAFPCRRTCTPADINPADPRRWMPSPGVRTLVYGAGKIEYDVRLDRPQLIVENELAVDGWSSNDPRASLVHMQLPFRVWRLAAGSYRFTATYHQAGTVIQECAAVAAILLLVTTLWFVRRRPSTHEPQR